MITDLSAQWAGSLNSERSRSRVTGGKVEARFCGSWRDNGSCSAEKFDSGRKKSLGGQTGVGPADSGVGPSGFSGCGTATRGLEHAPVPGLHHRTARSTWPWKGDTQCRATRGMLHWGLKPMVCAFWDDAFYCPTIAGARRTWEDIQTATVPGTAQ